jgi:hypothetical protein
MKAETNKTKTGKIASLVIVAAVVVGALAISGIADVSGGSMMSKLFILFLGAVIVLQIVPCMMLLAAMVKGVASLFHKKEKAAAGGEKK